MTTITITANTSHDRLYDAIVDGLENAGIDNYEINDSNSVPASAAPVARDAQELAEVRRLREAVEDVATAYERIDGGTETVKVYAADVAAKIRAAIAGEVASDE